MNGIQNCILEGTARNSFILLKDGSFFNQGSAGSMQSIVGVYVLPPRGKALVCKDYYFTYEKDETFKEIMYYHNTSGKFDRAVSKKITKAEYNTACHTLSKQIKGIQLIPFSAYTPSR